MTKSELIQILSFGREHACCVDLQHVPAAPGYVRTTTIHEDLRVSIEFDVWGLDEAGLYYWGKFENIELLISCLEEYLSRPIEQWRALGPYEYLPTPRETGTAESHRLFKDFLASGQALVPTSGNFKTKSTDWLPFLKTT
jgi:hypothetical protein